MKTSHAAEKKIQINETISTQNQGLLGQFGQVVSRVTGESLISQVKEKEMRKGKEKNRKGKK